MGRVDQGISSKRYGGRRKGGLWSELLLAAQDYFSRNCMGGGCSAVAAVDVELAEWPMTCVLPTLR